MPKMSPDFPDRRYSYDFELKNYDYDYPFNLNLKPKTEIHDKIVTNIVQMAFESNNVVSRRYEAWKRTDEVLTCYIEPSELETKIRAKSSTKPISVVIPQSYAIMELLLTYITAALLEDPIFRYEGSSPEDVLGSILLQKSIEYQARRSKMFLALHTTFRDSFAYGFGVGSPAWTTRYNVVERTVKLNSPIQSLKSRLFGSPTEMKVSVEQLSYEGNRIHYIDPYLYLPDPNVPVTDVQDGERAGWLEMTNLMDLLKEEGDGGELFNVRYLKHIGNCTSVINKNDSSGRGTRTNTARGVDYNRYGNTSNPVDTIFMYCKILPKEWKLPGGFNNKDGEYPEIWQFGVAGDSILISLKRLNLNHNMIPMAVCAPNTDGYAVAPISNVELFDGLQKVTDFLFNSFITGQRRSLNGMIVVDPDIINLNDLKDPEPGKLIRTRKARWGQGISDGIQQLRTDDSAFTNNINYVHAITEMMKNFSGATDNLSGARRKTAERVTAEEVRGDRFSSLSRLEHIAKMISWQYMHDMGYMLASQTQQLMTQETYYKITGEWQEVLMREYQQTSDYMKVSPYDILVDYDVIPKDGTIPGGNFSQAWIQMFQSIVSVPELNQKIDITKLFKAIMRELGAKNVDQFDRQMAPDQRAQYIQQAQQTPPNTQMSMASDEDVIRQAEAGNLVPFPTNQTEGGYSGGI